VQVRPSSAHDSPFFTTNSGAPVWNNNSSLTVGTRGPFLFLISWIQIITNMLNQWLLEMPLKLE